MTDILSNTPEDCHITLALAKKLQEANSMDYAGTIDQWAKNRTIAISFIHRSGGKIKSSKDVYQRCSSQIKSHKLFQSELPLLEKAVEQESCNLCLIQQKDDYRFLALTIVDGKYKFHLGTFV